MASLVIAGAHVELDWLVKNAKVTWQLRVEPIDRRRTKMALELDDAQMRALVEMFNTQAHDVDAVLRALTEAHEQRELARTQQIIDAGRQLSAGASSDLYSALGSAQIVRTDDTESRYFDGPT